MFYHLPALKKLLQQRLTANKDDSREFYMQKKKKEVTSSQKDSGPTVRQKQLGESGTFLSS